MSYDRHRDFRTVMNVDWSGVHILIELQWFENERWMDDISIERYTHVCTSYHRNHGGVVVAAFFPIQCAIPPSEDEYSIKLSMKITINSNENQTITRKSVYAAPHTNHLINIGRLNSNLLFMQIYGRITRVQLRKPTIDTKTTNLRLSRCFGVSLHFRPQKHIDAAFFAQ